MALLVFYFQRQQKSDTLLQKVKSKVMISSNIKLIMKEKKKTLRGLAKEACISDKTLDRARGPLIRESRMSTLEAIAKALGVKVKDLFEEVEDQDVPAK